MVIVAIKFVINKETVKLITNTLKCWKGIRIWMIIYGNQLGENQKGGLLNELLECVKDNIPFTKNITSLIRKQGAPIIKDHNGPMITHWLNQKLNEIIKGKEGSGLHL